MFERPRTDVYKTLLVMRAQSTEAWSILLSAEPSLRIAQYAQESMRIQRALNPIVTGQYALSRDLRGVTIIPLVLSMACA